MTGRLALSTNYQLSEQVAQVLIDKKELADFFESAIKVYSSAKEIAKLDC